MLLHPPCSLLELSVLLMLLVLLLLLVWLLYKLFHFCAVAMSCAHVFYAIPNALAGMPDQPGVPLERPGSTGAT